jgi:hypothetical protein
MCRPPDGLRPDERRRLLMKEREHEQEESNAWDKTKHADTLLNSRGV